MSGVGLYVGCALCGLFLKNWALTRFASTSIAVTQYFERVRSLLRFRLNIKSAYVNWSQIKGMHSPARTARQGLVALRLRLSSTVHFAVSIHDDIRWSWIEHSRIWQAVLFFYCKWVYLTSIVNSCGRFRSDIRCMQINTVEWYWSTEIKTKQLSASKQCCFLALVMLGASLWQWWSC